MANQHTEPTLPGQHTTGSVDKAPAAGSGQYIVGNWSHIFAADGPPTDVRIVFDTISHHLVAMQMHTHRGYVDAGRAQLADVQDSLLTANTHVIESPAAEGFQLAAEMPDWAAPECRNAAIAQFEREIAFTKVLHGLLISQLASELDAGGGDIADEFRWDVVDNAKGNLAAAAANATTDAPADQENAVAGAEAWVSEHVSNGSIEDLVAIAIALSSANDTEMAIFQLLTAPVAAPRGA
ncbi:MAG: hypothetical protein K2X55_07625 [Burkholderiaceae bacterium]|nr:hypothetical protein [Burkholderiaceae bacterium]